MADFEVKYGTAAPARVNVPDEQFFLATHEDVVRRVLGRHLQQRNYLTCGQIELVKDGEGGEYSGIHNDGHRNKFSIRTVD